MILCLSSNVQFFTFGSLTFHHLFCVFPQFMNDDSEGNITRAIVQGFSLVCQGNQRSVLMTEKAVMNVRENSTCLLSSIAGFAE